MKGPEKAEWVLYMTKIESEEKLSKLVIDYHISKVRKSEKNVIVQSLILKS